MEDSTKNYGHVTVGVGTGKERQIEIINFLKCEYKDQRMITVMELDNNEGFMLGVENYESSGRNTSSKMWLSKESFIGLLSTSLFYFESKNEDLKQLLTEAASGPEIHYSHSDNLNPGQ